MVEDVPQVASHVRSLLIAQTQIQIVEVIGDGERRSRRWGTSVPTS